MKNTFNVTVEEVLARVIEVEAESAEEAINIVSQKYRNEEIVLDSSDFVGEANIDIFDD